MTTIYRGLRLSNQQVSHLLARLGGPLPTRSHPWWATARGIALAYGTSLAVRQRSTPHPLSPVLLTATIVGGPPTSPNVALPDLRAWHDVRLTLTGLELL